ncbi:MAG: glycerophosphodiester phosphodiesterase family protein [Opitutaceae bacterium]
MKSIPKVIAHRGASAVAPENTLAAVEQAWKEQADGLECDVRLTADCQVVCIHDADTERVGDQNLLVEAHTYEGLEQVDVGAKKGDAYTGERIPLLSEWLTDVPDGKRLLIELKTGEEILTPLFDVLDAAAVDMEQVVIIVFDTDMVRALKARRPEVAVYWLIDVQSNWLGRSKLRLDDVLQTAKELQCEGLGLRCHSGIHRRMVQAILDAGLELNIWTVDDPSDARRYASFGVTSISSNRPQDMRDAMRG